MAIIWETQRKSIVNRYLERKAGKGIFEYRDNEAKDRMEFKPWEFILFKTGFTIKGYSKKHESGLYSQEVEYLSKQPLTILAHKNKQKLAEWLRRDIKPVAQMMGAKLNMVRTVWNTADNQIYKLFFSGSALGKAIEATQELGMSTHHLQISGVEKQDSQMGQYFTPIFSQGREIIETELEQAKEYAMAERGERMNAQKTHEENIEDTI